MHKITGKIVSGLQKHQKPREREFIGTLQDNFESSFYRFRKQRGVNLGSWFVLERWITDAPFRSAAPPAQSDLDVARGQNARSVLEVHYANWITESDWAWISDRGLNTVRIPIGYYHLCGADSSVLTGTDFENFSDVFSGAWVRLIQAIETAQRFGLGVLLDLHAAPGKQNKDAHAGTSNPATFFSNRRNRMHTIHVLRTLVTHLNAHSPRLVNVVGIELLNEPQPPVDAELKNWYSTAIKDISALDPTLPIYLGDCWKTDQYAEYIKSTPHPSPLLVLDHHLYRCFTSSDISTPASSHAQALTDKSAATPRMFARVAEILDSAGAGFIVGEWSGALNPGSLTGSPDDTKNYVTAQLQLYEAHCSGNFFWTYKKIGHRDRGWCLRDAVDGGVFPHKVGLFASRSSEGDHERQTQTRDNLKNIALNEHTAYWSKYPGKYRHERFAEGFTLGWDDAYIFFTANSRLDRPISELGFIGAWAKIRTDDQSNFLGIPSRIQARCECSQKGFPGKLLLIDVATVQMG
ncbi:Glycoside hydrolase family 5 protein [Mycena venus]|uniref:Glycoside hydrolase family 5 protein n=1 Tax=Mycena venus TaxID=2733690 RepID=A0A8H7D2H5_9AGAR|nr:Glycoside hydrolase family 5 protein [Mycena venus]